VARTGRASGLWVKTKNRATARFADERDGIGRRVTARA
jgi:hypothetical protein